MRAAGGWAGVRVTASERCVPAAREGCGSIWDPVWEGLYWAAFGRRRSEAASDSLNLIRHRSTHLPAQAQPSARESLCCHGRGGADSSWQVF